MTAKGRIAPGVVARDDDIQQGDTTTRYRSTVPSPKSASKSLKFSVSEKKVGKPRRKHPWVRTPAIRCPVCKRLFSNDGVSYRDHLPCTGGTT